MRFPRERRQVEGHLDGAEDEGGGEEVRAGLARKRGVSLRYIQLAKVRTAFRVGCPF